jgi:predicted phosphodiesterase
VDLEALRREHGSVDAVARALGEPRDKVRDWYKGRHLTLVPDDLSGGTSFLEEIPVIRRDYSHLEQLHVYPLGDVHLGAKMHDAERWADWLRWLTDTPNVSMIGTGDFLNSALKDSVSDVYEETMNVGDAKRLLRRQLAPLAERIDVMVPGNHEDRITKATGDCPIKDVCDVLEVPYAEAAVMLAVVVGDQEYLIYLRHGTGSGRSLASMEKAALVTDADIYLSGHVHQQVVFPSDWFRLDRETYKMVRRHRYHVVSASFLAYERYAAQKGYAPTRLGAPRLFLSGRSHDVRVSV